METHTESWIQNKTARCLGPLLRRATHWPPAVATAPSAAAGLAKRTAWQPQSWHKVQVVCVLASLMLFGYGQADAAEDIGAGTLTFTVDDGQSFDAPRLHTEVRMQITGVVARVEVHQRFENPGDGWVEGVYAFPLPENSAVDRLRMTVGERVIVGEIREKVAAKQLYEQAKASGQAASLVQQQRENLFRTSVANIGPHEVIDVTIDYLQIVDQTAGRYSLRFPLTITPRYLPGRTVDGALDDEDLDLMPPLAHADNSRESVSIGIDIDAGVPLDDVRSTYHPVAVTRNDQRYAIRLADEVVAPDHDFELAWTPVVVGEPAAAVFRERTDAGEHMLLMFMPPQQQVVLSTPREVIFVIDTSGSMSGESIVQARAALSEGLGTLRLQDRFAVIQFNSHVSTLFPQTVPATSWNIERARYYVNGLHANGGTEMLPAMTTALGMPTSGEYLRQVVFMTDGAIGNEDELMSAIRANLADARLFIVGIGSAPNGAFMRKAAQMGRGTFTYIGSTSEVHERMSGLLGKLQHPVLTDIELHWPDGVVPEYAPAKVGDLYAGEPIVVTARVQGDVRGTLTIGGLTTTRWVRQLNLDQPASREGVATLWARNSIGDLVDRLAGNVDEGNLDEEWVRSQVLPLALQYGLVTKYTSLVAIDRTPARPVDDPLASHRIANTKPQGSNWPAAGMPKTATAAELQMLVGAALLLLAAGFAGLARRRGESA